MKNENAIYMALRSCGMSQIEVFEAINILKTSSKLLVDRGMTAMPTKYRLRSITVNAIQVRPSTIEEIAIWCKGLAIKEQDELNHSRTIFAVTVPTKQGMRRAEENEYVVKSYEGNFIIMRKETFEATYEEV